MSRCPLHPAAALMNRRHWLQSLVQVAGLCFLLFFGQSPSSNSFENYFPHYDDIADKAKLLHKTTLIGHETKDFLVSTTGGGIALFDYDNDGWLDLFLVNGWGLREFPEGEEPTNHLYRNNHDGTFADVTEKAGLVRHGWGQGACVGDYDNDGNLDLFVTYFGRNVLYHNNGDGTFTDVTRPSGLSQPEECWNTGAAFLDYDRDGNVDLFVSNYVGHRYGMTLYESNPSLAGEQSPVLYGVAGLEGAHNLLYRNNGDGTFSDVSTIAGITKPGLTYGFTPCVADFDNDGWPDIYVTDDSTASLLFLNNRDGTFKETGLLAGVAFDANGRSQGGMGADAGDYDGDGFLDIVKTNFSDETPSLYHNDGHGFFTDATVQGGLAGQAAFVKWGTGFVDFDNDGHPDLLIVTGPIYPPGINARNSKLSQGSPLILCRNLGNGRFEDISTHAGPDVLRPRCSRGAAFGDLFHAGQIDIVVNNINDRPTLLRNQSPSSNAWLLVKLVGTKTNRAAIGSRVTIEAGKSRQIQEVRSGGSFCSQNDLRLHFGMGSASQVERMEVQWLSGAKEILRGVQVNRFITIEEGKGIIAQETF